MKILKILVLPAILFLSGCQDNAPDGFIKIADHIFIAEQHGQEDRRLRDGTTTRIIQLNVYFNLADGGSEIVQYEIVCRNGQYRFLGGRTYSDRLLNGRVLYVFQQENVLSRRLPQRGSHNETIIRHVQNSQAICRR